MEFEMSVQVFCSEADLEFVDRIKTIAQSFRDDHGYKLP